LEKQKLEKGDKPKKKPAAKVKATLRMEGDVSFIKSDYKKNLSFIFNFFRTITTLELVHTKQMTTTISCKQI
jgi:hypothetical protein